MRKILPFCLIALILLSACSKQKEVDPIDYEKVEEVLSFKGDPGAIVVAFNILSSSEKAYAFKKHLEDNENLNLNKAQIDLVKSIIGLIDPEMYIKNEKDKYIGVLATLAHQATELFSVKDYNRLFQNIQPLKDKLNGTPITEDAPGDCYCKWQSTCQAYADTAGPDCVTGGCTTTSTGCGFLWVSECTGKCGKKTGIDEEL